MKNKKRVVITGLGVVSCFGNDVDQFYRDLLAGKSGVKTITQFDVEPFTTKFAASILNFDCGDYLDKKQARRVDPFLAYSVVGGKRALEHANLGPEQREKLDKTRCGVLLGSGMGGMSIFSEGVQTLLEKGAKRMSPFFIPYTLTNMAGGMLAIEVGFMGPNYSISTACATGNYAIIAAANHIRNGDADLMLAGGVEAPINPVGLGGFCAIRALSTRNDAPEKASRQWNRSRDGFVMGEGAGVIVLESLEHAQKRGATILAEYLGGGYSCDAHHITELREDGLGVAMCIENALRDGGVQASDVNYVNAHATSTPQGDMVEITAMKRVFKDPSKVTINATKSLIGHSLGAAGGIAAVVVVKAIQEGKVHPTLNVDEDPEPNLGFDIPAKAVERKIKVGVSNSFGFGGHNAAVAFAPFHA